MNTTHATFLLVIACAALPAAARWPADSSVNQLVCDRPEMQTNARVCCTSDGGCYIAWYDRSAGGWDIHLQRYDAAGNLRWPSGSVKIADRPFQWKGRFDLAVDGEDHALVAYHDIRDGSDQMIVTRISPEGGPVWGEEGIQLTDCSGGVFVGFAQVAAASDGEIVVAWTHEVIKPALHPVIGMHRFAPDGTAVWPEPVLLEDPDYGEFWLCDLEASDDGAVIVSWVRSSGYCSPHHLWAQKYDPEGHPMWNADCVRGVPHVTVFDGGGLQVAAYPAFVPDGSGGAAFSWYRIDPGPKQVFAQHVLGDGTEAFGHNGSAVSTAPRLRGEPAVSFNGKTGETFVFWVEHHLGQSVDGIYGQKFDAKGARQWSDQGIILVPGGDPYCGQVSTVPHADGAIAVWLEDVGKEEYFLNAARLNGEGEFVWWPAIQAVCSHPASKNEPAVVKNCHDMVIAAWADGRGEDSDIYAQNINTDGVCGVRDGDVNGDDAVDVVDLLLLLDNWACDAGYCPGDLNQDGCTDVVDLVILLGDWG